MIRLFAVLLLWALMLPVAHGQSTRITTWELEGFETTGPDVPPTEADVKRLRTIAGHLKPLDAEVIILQGLTDRQLARRLTGFLKPLNYHVANYTTFKKGGTNNVVVGPSITILSKRQPFASRSLEWKATGQIDLPGGFVFAGFNQGTNAWCVYVAHLPGDLIVADSEVETRLTVRKRELAAQYLAHHVNWLSTSLTNQQVSFALGGNYAVDPRAARAESAVRLLQQAGFKAALPSVAAFRRGNRTNEAEHAAYFVTGLLGRQADFATTPQVLSKKGFPCPMVVYDLVPGNVPGPTAVAAAAPTIATNAASAGSGSDRSPAPAPSGPVPAKVVELDQSIIWLWVGGIGALSMTILFAVWLIRRATNRADVFRPRPDPAVVLDLSGFSGPRGPAGYHEREGASFSGSTTDSVHAEAALWQARALQAEERAEQAMVAARQGVTPLLGRLLRQRLFGWLISQRSQLLTSHEVGTQQVLELEERLQNIQGQFQDRLRSREERIALLEREILAKEKLIRDLMRAQVRLASQNQPSGE